MDYVDLALTILKFTGVIVAGSIGVIGAIVETKETPSINEQNLSVNRKSKLNRWGRIIVGLSVTGSIIALSAIVAEEVKSKEEGIKRAETTQTMIKHLQGQNVGLSEQSQIIQTLLQNQKEQSSLIQDESRSDSERARVLLENVEKQTESTYSLLEKMQLQSDFALKESQRNQTRAEDTLNKLQAQSLAAVSLLQSAATQESLSRDSLASIKKVIDKFATLRVSLLLEVKDNQGTEISALKSKLSEIARKQTARDDGAYTPPRQVGAQSFTKGGKLEWIGWDVDEQLPNLGANTNLFTMLEPRMFLAMDRHPVYFTSSLDDGELYIGLDKDDGSNPDIQSFAPVDGARVCIRYDCQNDRLLLLYTGFSFTSTELITNGSIVSVGDLNGVHGIVVLPNVSAHAFNEAFDIRPIILTIQVDDQVINLTDTTPPKAPGIIFGLRFTFPENVRQISYKKEQIPILEEMRKYKYGDGGNIITRPRLTIGESLKVNFNKRYRREFERRLDPSLDKPKALK
ncbi:MAG: hypothetical protein IT366_04335 [Candidatus Hydrogenedentes bacterium]|nr:hypothetical protein [Candidatus Hydrogenedentota bacterium]